MRRPVLSLGLAALSLSSMATLYAADAPAAASSAAPAAVTAPAPAAAPSASTQSSPSATTAMASAAPAASSAPAAASVAASAKTEAPAPGSASGQSAAQAVSAAAPAQAATPDQTVHTLPAPQPAAIGVPVRGMDMANVEHIFGTPVQKYDAVGKPPITRWDYPDYVVYFEYNMVLHTVMKN